MSELPSTLGGASLSPSATLSQAKNDLTAAREAAAALATALARQIQIASARSQTAATRATELAGLAQQAALAAANARASIETAHGHKVDQASLNAMAAVVQKLEALASRAAAGAQLAGQLATGEANLTTVLNEISTEARGVAEAANAARDTLARHQDPHQQAVGATGHEGASAEYLVG